MFAKVASDATAGGRGAMSSSRAARAHREALLTALGEAAAKRPLDRRALSDAARDVERHLGREVLVEAAGVVGHFENVTKCADATGKVPAPDWVLAPLAFFLGLMRWLYYWFQ
mmetsp:Transcript_46415/g.140571  ORF Transcript_46415/g.140571 Transcript_46415/m.140571 type:complete len:113 (+) Transcript_46415:1307-1645(+)